MKKIKVEVSKIHFCYSLGKTIEGRIVYIKNGDLKQENSTLDVIIINNKKNGLIHAEIPETYNNHLIINELNDNEGLISINSMDKIISSRLFELKKKWIFPHGLINDVLDYILENNRLTKTCKISVTDKRTIKSSARVFGLPFKDALKKIKKKGLEKARFFCESQQDFSTNGVIAEMLVNLTKDKNGLVTIETWQGIKENNQVYYTHAIMSSELNVFQHFDGAIIDFEITELNQLFRDNIKLKGNNYQKLFRLDGEISIEHIHEISNRFFPLDNLIKEYYKIEIIK